jgi:hypothetical protein
MERRSRSVNLHPQEDDSPAYSALQDFGGSRVGPFNMRSPQPFSLSIRETCCPRRFAQLSTADLVEGQTVGGGERIRAGLSTSHYAIRLLRDPTVKKQIGPIIRLLMAKISFAMTQGFAQTPSHTSEQALSLVRNLSCRPRYVFQ